MVAPTLWRSIGLKLLAPIGAFVALLSGLIGYISFSASQDFQEQSSERARRSAEAAAASFLDKLSQAAAFTRLVAGLPEMPDAVEVRDLRVLIDAAVPYVSFTDLDELRIYDRHGVVMANGAAPSVFGRPDDLVAWVLALAGAATDPPMATVERLGTGVFLFSGAPVASLNQTVGAVVVAGFRIDEAFLIGLKARSGVDTVAEYGGRSIAASLPPARLLSSTLRRIPVTLGPTLAAPAFSLAVLVDDSRDRQQFQRRLGIVIAVLLVSALAVTAGSILITTRAVTSPLAAVTKAMMALARGNSAVEIPCRERRDEIGVMAEAAEVFQRTMAETIDITAARERERLAKEHAEAEARTLAEANRHINAVFHASPVALVLLRGDPGRVVTANEAAARLFGVEPRKLRDLALLDLMADGGERQRLKKMLHDATPFGTFDARWWTPDGRDLWVSVSCARLSETAAAGILLGVQDITERKWAETQLRAAKEEAEAALGALKRTQESLIQSEKMASLSLLVSAVAHEINTPVGIGLTGASFLSDQTARVAEAFRAGRLRRSDFEQFLAVAKESSDLVLSNCGRAAELVQSFKQVAVDHTSAERRRFELASYIDDVLISLRPRWRRAGHEVVVRCPPGIELDSYPGAVAQIIANLLVNAITHAYDEPRSGVITIAVTATRETIELRFTDDGKGIPRMHQSRVFEPFFTTKRGAGGTGLGLYVVFNLVTQTLKGSIAVESEEGWGTAFILRFPRTANGQSP